MEVKELLLDNKIQALTNQHYRVLGGIEALTQLKKEQEDYNKERDKKW